ncbi:MAG: ABC transporter permease subunit [Planctomycetota bacterium]
MAPEKASALSIKAPFFIGRRGAVLIVFVLAAIVSYFSLGLELKTLWPSEGGRSIAAGFFSRAFSPAMHAEGEFVPANDPPLLQIAAEAAWLTFLFAAAAMGLALLIGIVFGFLASSAWWRGDPQGAESAAVKWLRRTLAPAVYVASRTFIAVIRSIHELLWAILFLTAFGLCDAAAILALALPYGGYLAKIFSELIDEASPTAAAGLRAVGAGSLQVFTFGLLTQALPDMIAYAFYRFECALRSSAVLGFFGFPTLGLFIRQSFNSSNYGEVWTYLYVLLLLIIVFDWWSGAVRKRLV